VGCAIWLQFKPNKQFTAERKAKVILLKQQSK